MAEAANSKSSLAISYARQAEKLSLQAHDVDDKGNHDATAVEARFITPVDPVIETANGGRLPAVPLKEALQLNKLRDEVNGVAAQPNSPGHEPGKTGHEESLDGASLNHHASKQFENPEAALRTAIPPSRTHPCFQSYLFMGRLP